MLRVVIALIVAIAAPPAWAGDKLLRGPVPDWVKPMTVSPPALAEADGPPVRILLEDSQLLFGADGQSRFIRSVRQIRSPLGLGAAGSISLAWSPDTDTLTVHHVRIQRGAEIIDVLAKQDFAVIRRETNLEDALIDGVLSATLQPEGVQAGDVIDIAYTLRRLDPVMQGRSEDILRARAYGRVDRLRLRATWDSKREIDWKAGSGLDKTIATKSGGRTEVIVDMKDVDSVKFPYGAPRRFYPVRDLMFSQFKSWAEVAALMEPHYAKASKLEPDSPLRAELEIIRKASPDPKVRAGLALQLVEDKIRYLAITLENGGYVPATADSTWRRRFGDCKAKSVLLVTLLHELGIEAEPVLVDSDGGEGLLDRLPGVTAFDHVIVRSEIGGRTYWLDGTRSGDTEIGQLRTPRFGHALPLRAAGAVLIALVQPPPERPDSGISLNVDASKGLDAPARARAELLLSGDIGHYMKLYSATLPTADREKALKQSFAGYPWLEPKSASITVDPATGQARLVVEGVARMTWAPKSNGPRWLLVPTATLGGGRVQKREPGPNADAPWAVPGHPSWVSSTITITLPESGEGFRIEGEDVDKTVAGRAYLRKSKIQKGVATIETSIRTVADEYPNSEAAEAAETLQQMAKVRVLVRAPPDYNPTKDDIAAWAVETPKVVGDFIGRGVRYATIGQHEKAIADFDKAISLDPKADFAWANRALSYSATGKLELAAADSAKALELDPRNYVAIQQQGSEAMRQGRYAEAAIAYGRAADLTRGNLFAMLAQANALWLSGESARALEILGQAQKAEPSDLRIRSLRYEILESRNEREKALAEVDDAIKASPDDSQLHIFRGGILSRMRRAADAAVAFERAIALRPTAGAYLTRLNYRDPKDIAGRLADLDLAEKAGSPPMTGLRAQILGDAGRYGEALAALDAALKVTPDRFDLLRERAEVLLRSSRTAEAGRLFTRLRTEAAASSDRLNSLCWVGATRNYALQAALSDCDAALKISPGNGAAIDSRAMVMLRLNRLPEAMDAYDRAVKLMPNNPESLYGRGLVRWQMGQRAESQADFAAARARALYIDTVFEGWGLRAAGTDVATSGGN